MSKKSASTGLSSSEFYEETSSSDDQRRKSSKKRSKKDSIKKYVNNVLTKQEKDGEQQTDLTQTHIKIDTAPDPFREYENSSAFRRYHSSTTDASTTDPQRQREQSSSSDDEIIDHTPIEGASELEDSLAELNLDPNPIHEVRESHEQIYRQKVYLRQLQPPTPQPVEIQVQEILVKPQTQKPPIHVHVGQRQPQTPSPILIKSAPPQPPPTESNQPIVYNKYIPPAKQPPQQIIIHHYPNLPPKPRPIVVEQWLPYKPAPKRIIKHTLPREDLQTPPPPHNIIVSYSKPRAVIEVELVRLPVVKIDPQTYEQMSAAGQQQLIRHPTFQHEQEYLSGNRSAHATPDANQINWRI